MTKSKNLFLLYHLCMMIYFMTINHQEFYTYQYKGYIKVSKKIKQTLALDQYQLQMKPKIECYWLLMYFAHYLYYTCQKSYTFLE